MQLISTLAAGVAAAPLGKAEVYVRGTSTRATIYAGFEASTSDSSGSDVQLDSYGSAIRYVNQLVDVRVKNADGSLVRSFVEGGAAPNTEVISAAFSGRDYVTAQQGTQKPTTLQAVLDLWLTKAGAPDWQVLVSGVPTSIVNAVNSVAGIFFNVKSPEFGATGDGSTNDVAAIQAAHDAAEAAGGGVVIFPPGEYRTLDTVRWGTGVSIFAVPGTVTLTRANGGETSAALSIEDESAPSGTPTFIYGMRFAGSGTAEGIQLSVTYGASDGLIVHSCEFVANAIDFQNAVYVNNAAVDQEFISCNFIGTGEKNVFVRLESSVSEQRTTHFSKCQFRNESATFGGVFIDPDENNMFVSDCTFSFGPITTSTDITTLPVAILGDNNQSKTVISGCRFFSQDDLGFAYSISDFDDANVIIDDTNIFSGLRARYYRDDTNHRLSSGYLSMLRFEARSVSGGTQTLNDQVETHLLSVDHTDAPDVFFHRPWFPGQLMRVGVKNATSGAWTSVIDYANIDDELPAPRPLAIPGSDLGLGDFSTITFVAVETAAGGDLFWLAYGEAFNG